MALNAEQLTAAARKWYQPYDCDGPAGEEQRKHIGDGPYRLLAAGDLKAVRHHGAYTPGTGFHLHAGYALEVFDKVVIPALCQRTHEVLTARRSLAVVPELVYDLIAARVIPRDNSDPLGWGATDGFFLDLDLGSASFADPPIEADMADVFVQAMSVRGHAPGTTGLGLATAMACERLGWRKIAALVNALDESMRASMDDVAAILWALTTEPARAG